MFQRYRCRFHFCITFFSAIIGRGAAFCQGSEDLEIPAFDSAYAERIVDAGTNLQQAISWQWFDSKTAWKTMGEVLCNINDNESADAIFMVIADHLGILKTLSTPVLIDYSALASKTDKHLRNINRASSFGVSMNGSVDCRYSPTQYVWHMCEIQMKRNAMEVADYRRQFLRNIKPRIHKYLCSLDAREYRLFVEEFSLRAILTDEERRELLGISNEIPDKDVEVGDVL